MDQAAKVLGECSYDSVLSCLQSQTYLTSAVAYQVRDLQGYSSNASGTASWTRA